MSSFTDQIDDLREAGNHDQAIALCQTFLKANPGAIDVMIALINVYTDFDDKERDIIKLATNILGIDPKNAEAYYHIASAKWVLKDARGAEKAYNEAIRLNPRYEEALAAKAMPLLYEQRRYSEMLEIGKDLIKLFPNKGLGWQIQAWAYNDMATRDNEPAHLTLAIDCCRHAIRLEPEVIGAYGIIADVYYKQEKYADALQMINIALGYNPNDELCLEMQLKIEQQLKKEAKKSFWKNLFS